MRGPDDDTPQIGRRFGDFIAVEKLEAGGMAEVYLAGRKDQHGVTLGAVKRLLPHLAWDLDFLRMFLAEAELASGLAHPGIVRVYDFGTAEGGHYLVMEYVHGTTLREILKRLDLQNVPLEFGVGIVAELASALHYAHEWRSPDGSVTGIVHRDLSPSNVMLSADGGVKLLDFGIARIEGRTQHTRAGTIKGNIGYMSPEQCRGETVDRRSDVFGLGVLLYELCVQQRAFPADNDYAFIGRILSGDYERPREADPAFPPALAEIIEHCLEVEPNDRPSDAAALETSLIAFAAEARYDIRPQRRAEQLHELIGETPLPAVDARTLRRLAAQSRPRRGWLPWAGLSMAVGGLGVAVGLGMAQTKPPAPVPAATDAPAVAPAPKSRPPEPTPEAAPVIEAPVEAEDPVEPQSEPAPTPPVSQKRGGRKSPKDRPEPAPDPQSPRKTVSIDAKALLPPSVRE